MDTTNDINNSQTVILFESILGNLDKLDARLEKEIERTQRLDSQLLTITNEINKVSQQVRDLGEMVTAMRDEQAAIAKEFDSLNTIRVNGSRGIQEAVQHLYERIMKQEKEQAEAQALGVYINQNKVLRFLFKTKPGIIFTIAFNVFVFLAVVHQFVPAIDPIVWIIAILKALKFFT